MIYASTWLQKSMTDGIEVTTGITQIEKEGMVGSIVPLVLAPTTRDVEIPQPFKIFHFPPLSSIMISPPCLYSDH
jgi:hypothetical protein